MNSLISTLLRHGRLVVEGGSINRPGNRQSLIKASTLGNSDRRYQGAYTGSARDHEAVPGLTNSVTFRRRGANYKDYIALTFLGMIYAHDSRKPVLA